MRMLTRPSLAVYLLSFILIQMSKRSSLPAEAPRDSLDRPWWSARGSICAVALRLIIFHATNIPMILHDRAELGTPLSGFRNLKEGVYLYSKDLNPYEGTSFHHSPLYVVLFSTLVPPTSFLLTSLLWTSADLISALALRSIWKSRRRKEGAWLSKWGGEWNDTAMLLFLLNPYTLLSCLSLSTTTLETSLLLLSISTACSSQLPLAAFFLAVSTHTQLYPVLLAPPLVMIVHDFSKGKSRWRKVTAQGLILFLAFMSGLFGIAIAVMGDLGFAARTWGLILSVQDLTPNVGMCWYFFTEMFDHFREFFVGVFQIHIALYVAPLCIRLYDQPLVVTMIMSGIISTFKSYPTLGDASVWIGLLGCFPDIWSDLRHPLVTVCVHLYTIILLPVLHDLWVVSGTGNANFFYAATLVYGLGCGMALVDILWAALKSQIGRTVIANLRKEQESGAQISIGSQDENSEGQGTLRTITDTTTLEDLGLVVVQYTTLEE